MKPYIHQASRAASILFIVAMLPSNALACPVGTEEHYLDYAVKSCFLNGLPRFIESSQSGGCPDGFIGRTDPQGYEHCSNGQINAYSFDNGCPDHFLESVDTVGNAACLDRSGAVVVELVDHLE